MDVVGAYLNTTLPDNEVIYIDPISGLYNNNNKVHRVVKSLYRLKQVGHVWNTELNAHLTNNRYYVRGCYSNCIVSDEIM